MKICLLQPPIEDFYTTAIRNLPLGLLSLAATLHQHQVQLIDLRWGKSRQLPIPADLKAVEPYYRADDESPFGLYKYFQRFGKSREAIAQLLPQNAQLFLIAALCTTYADTVYELIELIRNKVPAARIVVGGHHATVLPEEVMRAGADWVIRGEGEHALPRLITELEQPEPDFTRVPNLVWRDAAGNLQFNTLEVISDLDALPFADYQVAGLPRYRIAGKPLAMLLTSRGCPHRCIFCGIHQTMGGLHRQRSIGNVLEEMSVLFQQGYRWFDFEDDHLGGDKRWFRQFLQGVIERFGAGTLTLSAMNGITASNLDEEMLLLMRQAGFRSLNLSLVTPAKGHQRMLRRPVDTAQIMQTIAAAHRLGFTITTYLIIGLPGESAQAIFDALLLLAAQPTLIGPSLFYLVPGTPLFEEFKQQGVIPSSRLQYRATYYPVESADCERRAAMTLFRLCRLINFLKSLLDEGADWRTAEVNGEDKVWSTVSPSGGERRLIGLDLIRHLFLTGKLCGTKRSDQGGRVVVPEQVDQSLIDYFLRSDWVVRGARTGFALSKDELKRQLGV